MCKKTAGFLHIKNNFLIQGYVLNDPNYITPERAIFRKKV
jgi:hypothetical protein